MDKQTVGLENPQPLTADEIESAISDMEMTLTNAEMRLADFMVELDELQSFVQAVVNELDILRKEYNL